MKLSAGSFCLSFCHHRTCMAHRKKRGGKTAQLSPLPSKTTATFWELTLSTQYPALRKEGSLRTMPFLGPSSVHMVDTHSTSVTTNSRTKKNMGLEIHGSHRATENPESR